MPNRASSAVWVIGISAVSARSNSNRGRGPLPSSLCAAASMGQTSDLYEQMIEPLMRLSANTRIAALRTSEAVSTFPSSRYARAGTYPPSSRASRTGHTTLPDRRRPGPVRLVRSRLGA